MQHTMKPAPKKKLTSRAPAKLILTGEHAVVYGCPALALAVNCYTQTTVSWSTPLHFSFNLPGLDFRQKITSEALKRVKINLDKQYSKFHAGDIGIREVLKHPFELTLYSAVSILEKIKHTLPMGVSIHTESAVPMGCGMGSSAASVVSVIYALSQFLDIDFSLDDYIRLGIKSENLQHGYSSGLDVNVVYHGGFIRYQPGQLQKLDFKPFPLQLINTGQPVTSTGECVSHTKPFFTQKNLGPQFTAICQAMQNAIENNDLASIQHAVRENHRLLVQIGVVPEKIQRFVSAIEQHGMAAKICGAGAISGDNAGALLVVGNENIHQLCDEYQFNLTPVEIDANGCCLVPN